MAWLLSQGEHPPPQMPCDQAAADAEMESASASPLSSTWSSEADAAAESVAMAGLPQPTSSAAQLSAVDSLASSSRQTVYAQVLTY